MSGTGADYLVAALAQAGVERVYGVVGDSLNGFTDALLAIAAHIPSSEIGIDYFQATHPESLFKECSHYVMKAVLDGRAHELIDLARVNLDR